MKSSDSLIDHSFINLMTTIEDIQCRFEFICDKQWDDLEQTSQKSKRYCGDCARHVYLCNTEKQLERCQARRDCVCYQPRLEEEFVVLGIVEMLDPTEE